MKENVMFSDLLISKNVVHIIFPMIVKLTCSYAGEIRQIFCVSSFPVDWLTQKLGVHNQFLFNE